MDKIILAYDEDDADAGSYYKGCADHLVSLITSNCHFTFISKRNLNFVYVDQVLTDISEHNFLFFAYSHGEKHQLSCGLGHYLSCSSDLNPFNNTFFYSYACLAGNNFGETLIRSGCQGFFGYKNVVNHYSNHESLFIECTNYGIKMMLQGDNAVTAERKMKENYEEVADNLSGMLDFVAAELLDTRDALIRLGREDFKLSELGEYY